MLYLLFIIHHCTCEVAFQVRTALQLYEAHRITRRRRNHDDCTRSALLLEVSMVSHCVRTLSHSVISPTNEFDTVLPFLRHKVHFSMSWIIACRAWSLCLPVELYLARTALQWYFMWVCTLAALVYLTWPLMRCHNDSCECAHCWTWPSLICIATISQVNVYRKLMNLYCPDLLS